MVQSIGYSSYVQTCDISLNTQATSPHFRYITSFRTFPDCTEYYGMTKNMRHALLNSLSVISSSSNVQNPVTSHTLSWASPTIFDRSLTNPVIPLAVNPAHSTQTSNDECEPFEVDYGEDILEVYKSFLEHAIEKSGSINILWKPRASDNIPNTPTKENAPKTIGLPLWILDVTRRPSRATAQGKMIRYNPGSFVGVSHSRGSFCTASEGRGQKNAEKPFETDRTPGLKTITVQGFKLGEPSEI
ncbi:hypothetical protein F4679DRAFT_588342 [Xylaria curta]|nr:hypothetical protein F4679DRAFT_588342 [Xylaria curta]